jgi:ADP-ribose pyrophosphatase
MMRCQPGPRTLVHRTPRGNVWHLTGDFGTFRKEYHIFEFGPRAGVVALRETAVLLLRQYRFLIDRLSWEIPGGGGNADESPAATAIRETREETRIECHDLEPLLTYYPGLDNVDNRTAIFISRRQTIVAPFVANPKEAVEIAWIPLAECVRMIMAGEILDALTVAGILGAHAIGTSGSLRRTR